MPALGAVATVLALMMTGVMATPLAISGTQMTVTADSLVTGASTNQSEFVQYGAVDGTTGVAVNMIKHADLTNMNQVVCGAIGHGLDLKLTIHATSAAADNMIVDATSLNGNATFTNIAIGVPAPGTINDPAAVGTFAQVADSANIDTLSQQAVFTSAGTFSLKGMTLSANIVPAGTNGC